MSSDSENDLEGELSPRRKKNGLHKGPLEIYVIRISPACRAVLLYMQQVRRVQRCVSFENSSQSQDFDIKNKICV